MRNQIANELYNKLRGGRGVTQKCDQVFIQKSQAFIDFFPVFPECLLESRILVKENLRSDEQKKA